MTRPVAIAVTLMRMALALLDREGEDIAATRLQYAIDAATHAPVPPCDEGIYLGASPSPPSPDND